MSRAIRKVRPSEQYESCYLRGKLEETERHSVMSEELGASDDYVNEALWRTLAAHEL
jgi:hypothetical protein